MLSGCRAAGRETTGDGFLLDCRRGRGCEGKLYFVDRHQQRIYGWSEAEGLTIERDSPLDPVNLGFRRGGEPDGGFFRGPEGTVYSFRPGSPKDEIAVLQAGAGQAAAGGIALLPVNYWKTASSVTSSIWTRCSTKRYRRCLPRM